MFRRRRVLLLVATLQLCCRSGSAQQMTAEEILAQAPRRIREYRTAELVVRVTDRHGNPIRGAEVEVRQTGHDFLFGCNIFRWRQETERDLAFDAAYSGETLQQPTPPEETEKYHQQFAPQNGGDSSLPLRSAQSGGSE